jgi:Domain of unknown function (DUF4377)
MKRVLASFGLALALIGCHQTTVTEFPLYVAPQLYVAPASGSSQLRPQLSPVPGCYTNCLQVSQNADVTNPTLLFPNEISGFTFEQNFKYKLQVRLTTGTNFYRTYQLLQVLEKSPTP